MAIPGQSPRVIFTADDFGRAPQINAAVIQAHREGVLTAASLMVAGEAAEAATILAREYPSLAIGLHLTLGGGQAVLPPAEIPHLVDSRGRFADNAFELGLRYSLSRSARNELRREIAAQFERFAATGLPLSHVDGHMHLHIVPAVFEITLPLAVQYGARGVRLPADDLRLALSYDRRRARIEIIWAIALDLLCRHYRRRLRDLPLTCVHRVYGVIHSGRMHTDYVIRLLNGLNVPSAELYFHPSLAEQSEPLGPNPGDLATLLSPEMREVIRKRRLCLTTYPALWAAIAGEM